MNINFQTITGQKTGNDSILSGMDAEERIVSQPSKSGSISKSGCALDINGSGFTDNAYADHARSAGDISQMAENTDVQNRHNFMALLSNTMSEEDYAKALEDGVDIKDINSSEAVSIVDKIKSILLESGEVVAGFNDDLSLEKLKKITGSDAFAKALSDSFHENDIPVTQDNIKSARTALEQVGDITSLDDSAVKFMVLNNMEPTIENVYFAAHSTNGQNVSGRGFYAQESGYYAQKADSYDWNQLKPQMDKVIEEAGLDTEDEETVDNSKWMVKQGIPLTAENLVKVNKLKAVELPLSVEDGARAVAGAIADGKRAIDGNLYDQRSKLQKAKELVDDVNHINDEALKSTVVYGKELTIRNLMYARPLQGSNLIEENDTRLVQARIQLEEVRLQMTTEANKQLLDSGFSIDTAPMKELIERLKNTMGEMSNEVSGNIIDKVTGITPQNATYSISFTMTRVNMIAEGPIDIIGDMADEFESASLFDISKRAESMTERFRRAGEGYEKLMTAPRADLGDSIKKAFRNVDDILEDVNTVINEESRRAVRILGYNRMEVSAENIEKVRAWDQKLQAAIERLKPGAVLDLIREGKNPLDMTIEELSQNLDQGSSNSKENDKYARFLYKMDKKGEITEAERTSFIGIYRLFNTLKNTDYQAIGSLLKTKQDMTIGNLLNATRNQKASRRGTDFRVDDNFGGVELRASENLRIDEQISSAFRYYTAKAEIVYENLEPEKLLEASPNNNTLLPELAEKLKRAETDTDLEREFVKEQMRQIRNTASLKAAEPAMEELVNQSVELTYNNLEAEINIRRERRNSNLWDRARDYEETSLLSDKLEDDDYEENYVKLLGNISDKLSEELINDTDSYIDVRAISLMQKQLSVMQKASDSGSYEVPVEIDGERVSMHVTLRSDESSATRMDAGIQTEMYGYITLSLYEDQGRIRGMLTTTNGKNQEEAEYLENVRTGLCANIEKKLEGFRMSHDDIPILYHTQNGPASVGAVNTVAKDGSEESHIETRTLLTMAKAFIEAL